MVLTMGNEHGHLSDAQLVEISDWEVPRREARRMEEHLAACWLCRSRRAELERSVANYLRAHRSAIEKMPPMDEARARLLAELVQLSAAKPTETGSTRRPGGFAYGGAAACLVLGVGLVLYFGVLRVSATPVPNNQLTPGATRTVTKEDICSSD